LHAADAFEPGDKVVADYEFAYKGLIVKGVSKYVFTLTIIEMNSNKTQAKVKLTNITRYWNDEVREKDIQAMPHLDPRGYKTAPAPSAWGKKAEIGDMTWLDVKDLSKP